MTSIDPRDIVAAKRDGETLTRAEVEEFTEAFLAGRVSDALAAAFLMAALIRGLAAEETLALTEAMVGSGETLSLRAGTRPTIDKHSTGGVADGVTLVFAPMAAALGLGVAKLSGRGLGHTGGTLDKLESIPGLRTDLTPEQIRDQVEGVGCVVAAQSASIVPLDGAWYALRDATATVPSIPLIAASVMSKKLAVVTDLILLDVKVGSGAFMKTPEQAEALAAACAELAMGFGRQIRIAVTDMSQPLGDAVGNALDILEAIDVLRGSHGGRLRDLAVAFAAEALTATSGVAPAEATTRAEAVLRDGSALERFRLLVEAQGGDPHVVERPRDVLPRARVIVPLLAARSGTLATVDAEQIGLASGALGAGRARKGDAIDPAVGIVLRPKVGDRLEAGTPIGEIHARDDEDAAAAAAKVLAAMQVIDGPVDPPPVIRSWISMEP